MRKVRMIGFAVLAVAAVAVTFLAAPEQSEPVNTSVYQRQLAQAIEDNEANDRITQGAPQQQVANGWIARDLLTIQTEQLNAMLAASQTQAGDPRIPLLLMLAVLAVALHGATHPSHRVAAEVTRLGGTDGWSSPERPALQGDRTASASADEVTIPSPPDDVQ